MRPAARGYHAMAYDSGSDLVVLFGGYAGGENGETWTYDANTNVWIRKNPSPSPSARDSMAMTYDAASDRIILFGGISGATPHGDTWAYNVDANGWTERSPSVSPPARYGARIAYDAGADRVILFGGEDGSGGIYADTWAYDYNANGWTPLTLMGAPPARSYESLTYDAESNLIVMFGGLAPPGAPNTHGDTWTFDYAADTWTQRSPAVSPSARGWSATAYADGGSRGLDRVFLFGGDSGPTETWDYSANTDTWAELVTASTPSARHEATMAFDLESRRLVLFGGMWPVGLITDPSVRPNRETWLLDGVSGTWTMVDGPEAPVAAFTFSPVAPPAQSQVTFNATASIDPDGTIVSFAWAFGDGGTGYGATAHHMFSGGGTYTVSLTATDNDGLTNATTQQVVISPTPDTAVPSVVITSPANGATLNSATATVGGTASDNVAVAKVELSTDGTTWALAGGTTSWSGAVILAEGENTVYARATDSSNNAFTANITVTVVPPRGGNPPPYTLLAVVGAAAAAAAVVGVLLIRRRRTRK